MGLLDMTPEQSGNLLNLGMGLLAASGPSRMPVSLGQALASGYGQMQQGIQQRRKNALEDQQAQLSRENFDLQKSYKALQEQQMLLSMQAAAREQEARNRFMGMAQGLMNPAPQVTGVELNGAPMDNVRIQPGAENDVLSAANRLIQKQQAGGKLTDDEQWLVSQARTRAQPVTQPGQMDVAKLAQLSALGQLAGVKGADGMMKLAEFNAPDWQQIDSGGQIQFVNKKSGQMPTIQKTMSPDAVASNLLGRERLGFEMRQWENPNKQHIETATGVASYDPRTGNATPVIDTSTGKPVRGGKGLTESQGKATTFGIRARQASDIIDSVGQGGEVQPGFIKRTADAVPLIGDGLGMVMNWTQSDDQQRVEQAQRDFINAVLRLESGAAIAQPEFDNARRQYFPQLGDSAAVIAQKKANREAQIRGLEIMAGPGMNMAPQQSTMSGGGWSATVIK